MLCCTTATNRCGPSRSKTHQTSEPDRSALILDSLDAKKGSVKGLCMAEAKRAKFGKEGEASRFLKVIVEVLKCAFSLITRAPRL